MMKTKTFIQLLFFCVLGVVLTSCVPKATEKKAACGTNQAFNSITRTCVSVLEPRYKPVATLSSAALTQETASTITLSYTDGNKNPALSCRVYSPSSNIEPVSPTVINGGVFAKLDLLVATIVNLYYATDAVSPGIVPLAHLTAITDAVATAKATFTYSTLVTQLGIISTEVNTIMSASAAYLTTSTVATYYDLAVPRRADFNTYSSMVTNRCECSAGVCTTMIAPKIRQSGAAGFSYAITDVDGEGDPKAVTLSVAAAAAGASDYKPVAKSSYVSTYTESSTATPSTYSFTLPSSGDYFGTTAGSFSYKFVGTKVSSYGKTTNGRVYGCMDLVASSGSTDKTCLYIPDSGDAFYSGAAPQKASVTLASNLKFDALAEGSFANNYSVQIINMTSVDPAVQAENFGLVSSTYTDTYVRVVDNTIKIYIGDKTTPADIVSAVNTDAKAKYMVTASDVGATTFTTMASPASLTGGTDAFDSVTFTTSNAYSTSTNTATVLFSMAAADDAPLTPTEYNSAYMPLTLSAATTSAMAEGDAVGQTITLPYYDADNSPVVKAVTCAIDFATLPNIGLSYKVPTTCACDGAGVCTAIVVPNALFNGTGKFSYTITTIDQNSVTTATSGSQTVNVSVWEVNDTPTLTLTSASTTAGAVTTNSVAPLPNPWHVQENSTSTPSSSYICFTATAGGGSDESTQTLTVTPTQVTPTSNASLVLTFGTVLAPGAASNTCGAGQYLVPFTSTQNQSGTTNIKITVADNGTTHSVSDPLSTNTTIPLTVDSVDDPPYFSQSITSVQTNEGGAVVAGPFTVDEDTANSPDEDVQQIKIANITSDNTSVLPVSAISVFYDLNDNGVEDSGEARTFGSSSTVLPASQDLEAAAGADVIGHSFYLKLSPVPGNSGNSNISVTINDGILGASNSHMVTKTFSLITNSIAAQHGGWSHISAVGPKTDKNGAPAATSDIACNYDTNKCDGTSSCTGTTAPNSSVVPADVNVLFWDSANKRCYRSQAAGDKFSWIEMKTTCPITRSGGVNFIYDSSLLPAQSIPTPTAVDQYYYNPITNICYYSNQPTPGTFAWNANYVPAKVTLSWNSFTISGSGSDSTATIEGWNVYRREKGYDFDFKNGFLKTNSSDTKTISSSLTRTFVDNTAIAGKVYYYLVRPVDSIHHLPTYTPEVFSEVRVLAPTENYSFVHRWMVNQEVCNSMHMTTSTTNKVDPTHNYRCPYKGPGEGTGANVGYYDIGKDMLVDISESGCPFTKAPACTASGCIGIGAPTGGGLNISAAAAGNIFYDRNSGSCYLANSTAAGDWTTFNSAALGASNIAKSNTALNPPLTNISMSQASSICQLRSTATPLANLGIANGGTSNPVANALLPSKKEYIAYSAAPTSLSDSLITDLEQGYSLNVQSRCNSTNANGIDVAFTDSTIPSTSYIFSLPGTASSSIRSIYTGSVPWGMNFSTESCSSRYGVQDIYGNVAEWVLDTMSCPNAANFVCSMTSSTDLGNYNFTAEDYSAGVATDHYRFDLSTGPFADDGSGAPSAGDSYLTEWDFKDELFNAGKFNFPMGMPINVDIGTAFSGKTFLNYLLDVGLTSGLTPNQLHEDGIIVNGAVINATAGKTGSFAQGGSYLSGNRAGRYTSELVPDSVTNRPDVGFRCYIPIDKGDYPVDSGRHTYSY